MLRRWTTAAIAVLATVSTVTPAAAAPAPPCVEVALSPAFARDHTLWCGASVPGEGAYVYRSTNGGRTWGRPVEVDVADARDFMVTIHPSPLYPTDHRVLVQTVNGTYESLDGGVSFDTEPVYTGDGYVTPFVDTLGTGSPHAVFVHGIEGSSVYDTALGERMVAPIPNYHVGWYIVPPDYSSSREAVAVAYPALSWFHDDKPVIAGWATFRCNADFVCVRKEFQFSNSMWWTEAGGALGAPGQHYLVAREAPTDHGHLLIYGPTRVWRTRDYGSTWQEWTSVEKVLDSEKGVTWADKGPEWETSITASPDGRALFMSVATITRKGKDFKFGTDNAYRMSVYRSVDDGRTWQRLSVPWTRPPYMHTVHIVAADARRLYATATRGSYGSTVGLFCSLDAGRSWQFGRC